MQRWRSFAPAATVIVAVVVFVVGQHLWRARRDRAPYSAAALNAHVSMKAVSPDAAQAEIDKLAGQGHMWAVEPPDGMRSTTQELVGQLTFDVPALAPANGEYALFIIDDRSKQLTPSLYGVGAPGSNVVAGWDGRYNELAKRYRWLVPTASINTGDGTGWHAPGMSIEFAPTTQGPVTFDGVLNNALPITDPARQLTIGLAFFGPNGTLYWAQQLMAS